MTLTAAPRPMPASARRSGVRRSAVGVLVVVLGAVVGVSLVAEPMRVSSGSMAPSYRTGAEVIVEKVSSRSRDPANGDVIAFHEPGTGDLLIKRVAGLPGEHVDIADGVLRIDGTPVKEPYLDPATVDGTYFGPVRVPAGHVFVMGDARAGAVDSRTFGPVPREAIVGRVILRLW
jgi:signal peptidase I